MTVNQGSSDRAPATNAGAHDSADAPNARPNPPDHATGPSPVAPQGQSRSAGPTAQMWTGDGHDLDARRSVREGDGAPKTVSDSTVTLAHIMGAGDTNLYGGVHGGVIMKLVDDAAAATAARHAGGPAVTASIDSMKFVNPALVGDLLKVEATLANVGRTSMDVHVRVSATRWNEPGREREIVKAFLTFVAVDAHGASRAVPALTIQNAEEQERQQSALSHRRRR